MRASSVFTNLKNHKHNKINRDLLKLLIRKTKKARLRQ